MKLIRFLYFLTPILAIILPFFAFAAIGSVPWPLVPCGTSQNQTPCSIACFYVMVDNVIKFILWGIATPLGATALMVAGIMMVLGGSQKAIEQGKAILRYTLTGLFIAFAAYLIVDLILGNLLVEGSIYKPWNRFPSGDCVVGAAPPPSSPPPPPPPPSPCVPKTFEQACAGKDCGMAGNGCGGEISCGPPCAVPSPIDTGDYIDGIDTSTPEYQVYASQPPEGSSLRTSPGSSIYNSNIDNFVLGASLNGVDINRVRAIIQAESSGVTSAKEQGADGKSSYGLMQVRADTARLYDRSLAGLTDAQIGNKLLDPQYNINIGTKYYSDLLKKYNNNPTLASAAYNGGPVANNPSVDCAGEPSPYGGTMRRWECQWDNLAHTVPNIGYRPTRRYINNINTVYSQF